MIVFDFNNSNHFEHSFCWFSMILKHQFQSIYSLRLMKKRFWLFLDESRSAYRKNALIRRNRINALIRLGETKLKGVLSTNESL